MIRTQISFTHTFMLIFFPTVLWCLKVKLPESHLKPCTAVVQSWNQFMFHWHVKHQANFSSDFEKTGPNWFKDLFEILLPLKFIVPKHFYW